MFEKMTKREKVLAAVVGSLVPLAVVFMALVWFIGSYNYNEIAIQGLRRDIRAENDKIDARDRANQRKHYYRAISFPSDMSRADVDYVFWLRNLIEKDVAMQFQGLTRMEGVQVKYENNIVYNQRGYRLTAKGTLDQLTHFLYEFYRLPMLHRINKVNITPRTAGTVGERKNIRTGEHSFTIGIDILSVKGADDERNFADEERLPMPKQLDEYTEKIVYRNIFGPANNTPTVDANTPAKFYPDVELKFSLVGQDADENDILNYKLVNCDIPDAKIVVGEGRNRRAQFVASEMPIGTYEFQVVVADNGYPSKSSTTDVTVNVVKRPNARPAFVTSTRLEAIAGKPLEIEIVAEDDDQSNQLSFELTESEIENAELKDIENGKIVLTAPALETGEYTFKLKVQDDDAEDSKYAERNFRVTVNPPEFVIASQTQITGILNSRRGDMVWINVRPTGSFHKLLVGESLEVDEQIWTVDSIDVAAHSVWLSHGGKLKQYKTDDFLTAPRDEKSVVKPIVSKPVSKDSSN